MPRDLYPLADVTDIDFGDLWLAEGLECSYKRRLCTDFDLIRERVQIQPWTDGCRISNIWMVRPLVYDELPKMLWHILSGRRTAQIYTYGEEALEIIQDLPGLLTLYNSCDSYDPSYLQSFS